LITRAGKGRQVKECAQVIHIILPDGAGSWSSHRSIWAFSYRLMLLRTRYPNIYFSGWNINKNEPVKYLVLLTRITIFVIVLSLKCGLN